MGNAKSYTFFYNSLGYDTNDYGYFKVWKDTAAYDGVAGFDSQNNRIIYGKAVSGEYNTAVSLDIIGHEYGHKIVYNKGGGIQNNYRDEMAAIEEGYADIFGRCLQENVESYNASRIEVLGEDIAIDPTFKRSFSNPNSLGFHFEGMSETPILGQPDTYEGDYFYRGTLDFGGAHINGGVINYRFYLLTHGGNGINDFNDSYNITGIGSNKAFKIVYHSLPLLMYETSFSDARNATIVAAENLYGLGSNESQQVLNAWEAVGVDGNCLSSGLDTPDFICTGTSVSVLNCPAGASIIWNQSSNIIRNSAQGSNPCSFSANNFDVGWIEATINSSCNGTEIIRDSVLAGTLYINPTSIVFTNGEEGTGSFCTNCFGNVAKVPVPGDFDQLDVKLTNLAETQTLRDFSVMGDAAGDVYIMMDVVGISAGTYMFWVRGTNDCGTAGWTKKGVQYLTCGGLLLAITPNPTTGETTLSIENTTEETEFDINEEWDLEIYNNSQMLTAKKTKLIGNEYRLNTSGWKDGVYMVRVTYKGEILTGKLVVK